MKTIQFVLCLTVAALSMRVAAQKRLGAYGVVNLGYTAPAKAEGFLADGAAGLTIGRLGVGLATGMDWAQQRSTPLLLDTRFQVMNRLNFFTQEGANLVSKKADKMGDTWGDGWYWRSGFDWQLVRTKGMKGLYVGGSVRYRSYKEYENESWIDLLPEGNGLPWFRINQLHQWGLVVSAGWRW